GLEPRDPGAWRASARAALRRAARVVGVALPARALPVAEAPPAGRHDRLEGLNAGVVRHGGRRVARGVGERVQAGGRGPRVVVEPVRLDLAHELGDEARADVERAGTGGPVGREVTAHEVGADRLLVLSLQVAYRYPTLVVVVVAGDGEDQ